MLEVAIILGLAAVVAGAVVIYWTKVLKWGLNSLLPWIDTNIPQLSESARDAFVVIDKIAAPLRALVKEKWQRVRQTLLRQIADFEQQTTSTWILRLTSWVKVKLGSEPVVKQIQTEQVISFDELPPQVREEYLRQGKLKHQIDITHAHDAEMELAMTA